MLDRAWKICTNYELFHIEVLNIKQILVRNEYPLTVEDHEIKIFLDKKYTSKAVPSVDPTSINETELKRKLYLVLPYVNSKMEEFSSKICKLVNEFYPDVQLRVMFTCPTTIGNMFKFKDKTPDQLRSLVVYRINCKDCGEFYVGKTSRCICRRVFEHKRGTGTGEYKSSLLKHATNTGHTMDYDNIEILDEASSDHKLLLKEMLHINKLNPQFNIQKSLLCSA